MKFGIAGLGAMGPGFSNWKDLQTLIVAQIQNGMEPAVPAPESMSKRERARAPYLVKLAIAAAEQACAQSGYAPRDLAMVFASSMSDTELTDYMCRTLVENPKELSPTRFHNSVHNAAAGYWAIGNSVNMPATAISGANQHTAALALVEAVTQCQEDKSPVLLVLYDIVCPETLKCIVDIGDAAVFAMVLTPPSDGKSALAVLDLEDSEPASEGVCLSGGSGLSEYGEPTTHQIRLHNPISVILPLLESLALKEPIELYLAISEHRSIVITNG